MNSDEIDRLLFGEKRCPVCERDKPANSEHFNREVAETDGLTRICKDCRAAAATTPRAMELHRQRDRARRARLRARGA